MIASLLVALFLALIHLMIGSLVVLRERPGLLPLVSFTLAMEPHFVVNDYELRQNYKQAYSHTGHWFLSATVVPLTVPAMESETHFR